LLKAQLTHVLVSMFFIYLMTTTLYPVDLMVARIPLAC
jgi:hypothetical protein